MTTAFTRTREQLAAMVLKKLGVLRSGGTANSNDLTDVYEAIDLRLKEMHRLGVVWHKVTKVPLSFSIPANVNSASASVDIQFPISLHVVNASVDDPVRIIDIREYADIENKTEQGVPTMALWKGSAEFLFWPVPTAITTAKLVYEKIADDTAASTAPDVEVSMLRWLRDIIAYDLGDNKGKSEATMMRWAKEAQTAERNIRKLTVQHADYAPVAVDDYRTSGMSNTKTDWRT